VQTARATDALMLLEAIAASHPQATDLTFESWELGFSSQRMEQALEALLAAGCVELEPAAAPTYASHARLTAKGSELVRTHSLGAAQPAGERRRTRDRRVALAPSPPPGLADRRSHHDRRHLSAA
jgi:hypothetical protein